MSHYFSRTMLGGLFIAVYVIATASGAWANEVAGVVTSVSGTWLVNGEQIKLGRKLHVGAVINAKEPNVKYGGIEILLLDYTEVRRVCDRKGHCGQPIKLPDAIPATRNRSRASPKPPGFWERVVTALNTSKLRRAPFRKTLARGGSLPPDMVLRLKQGRVDLSPVLTTFAEQELLIDLEVVNKETGAGAGERRVLNWKGRGKAFVEVPDSVGGALYRMTLSTPDGGNYMAPGDVWVLLVPAPSYRKTASEFENARALTRHWDVQTEPRAENFLREFLATLSRENLR
jgi:hypothetical protein